MKTNLFGPSVEFERHADGRVYFKLRDIVRALGLEWASQLAKAKSDPHGRYQIVMERFSTEDDKTAMSAAIPSDNVQNFLEDIGINRCPTDVSKMVIKLRDELRGENLAEKAMHHLV